MAGADACRERKAGVVSGLCAFDVEFCGADVEFVVFDVGQTQQRCLVDFVLCGDGREDIGVVKVGGENIYALVNA